MAAVSKEDTINSSEGGARRFGPRGKALVRLATIAISIYILLYISTALQLIGFTLYGSHRALVYSMLIFMVFVLYPATSNGPWTYVPWYDLLFGFVGAASSFYAFVYWDAWLFGIGIPEKHEEVLGIALVLLTLEASRRSLGLAFTSVAAVLILYPLVGHYLPGFLRTQPNSISSIVQNFYFVGTSNGIFGAPLEIFSTTVAIFIIYGAFLTVTGAAQTFLDAAIALTGRFRAGMAKVAVIASALFGTISGVGAANVLVTGSFTIPAMKKMGYRPALAAGVEAAASTGGLLMPPVMGAAAFLMADFIGVPYWNIAVAALIPAILYYLAIFIIVDFEGARENLAGIDRKEIPGVRETFRKGWFLFASIAALLVLLGVFNLPVDQAAFGALAVLVVLAATQMRGQTWTKIMAGLEQGGRDLVALGVTGAVVGLITGGFALTGLGAVIPQALSALSGDSLFLLLIMTAIAAAILGMGAPPLLVYVLLATSLAPAIIAAGVSPLATHMFIFYYGLLSMLTPPVALCSMIAARVAGAAFWPASVEACRLALVAYIVPFFFIFNPVLLMQGSWNEIAVGAATATIGVISLASGLTRYFFFRSLAIWEAILMFVGGVLLFFPESKTDLIGAALILAPVARSAFVYMSRERNATVQG